MIGRRERQEVDVTHGRTVSSSDKEQTTKLKHSAPCLARYFQILFQHWNDSNISIQFWHRLSHKRYPGQDERKQSRDCAQFKETTKRTHDTNDAVGLESAVAVRRKRSTGMPICVAARKAKGLHTQIKSVRGDRDKGL